MREFSKVNPQLWSRRNFKQLSPNGKLVMLYFLTCRHQTSAGCYHIPDGYACADLGWTGEVYRAALQEVRAAGLVIFDDETSDIYILGWYEDNPITNEKHKMGAERLISNIESRDVYDMALNEMEESYGR